MEKSNLKSDSGLNVFKTEWSETKMFSAINWWRKGRGVFNTDLYERFLEVRRNMLNNTENPSYAK